MGSILQQMVLCQSIPEHSHSQITFHLLQDFKEMKLHFIFIYFDNLLTYLDPLLVAQLAIWGGCQGQTWKKARPTQPLVAGIFEDCGRIYKIC